MKVVRPGQTFPIAMAQIVIVDGTGDAHAWEITDGTANWDFTGVGGSGRSTAKVTLAGTFRRRTKQIPQRQGERVITDIKIAQVSLVPESLRPEWTAELKDGDEDA